MKKENKFELLGIEIAEAMKEALETIKVLTEEKAKILAELETSKKQNQKLAIANEILKKRNHGKRTEKESN